MRAPEPRRVVSAVAVLVVLAGGGCAAGDDPPLPTPSPTTTPSVPSAAPIPADGVSLQALGFLNGPVQQFSLPKTALLQAAVDQANNVTAVVTQPPPDEVATYLRRTLPATGFTITADDPAGLALTFTGYGWIGSFTGSQATSAVLLRPA